MYKENVELNDPNYVMTEPMLIGKILDAHPEILQVSMASYAPRPHGVVSADFYRGYFPVMTEKHTLVEGSWRVTHPMEKEIIAIGSTVDVCDEKGCRHSDGEHEDVMLDIWDSWHDGIPRPYGIQKSFIFIDVETHGDQTLGVTKKVLAGVDYDWYLLDSGAGYHVILDKLVGVDQVAIEYGNIITQFGEHLSKPGLVGWGRDLIENGRNEQKVESWCRDVLLSCGHIDEPIYKSGKEVHILDLKHTAHSLLRVQAMTKAIRIEKGPFMYPYSEVGGAYLRISPKRSDGLLPILVAQSVGGVQKDFNNPFQNDHLSKGGFI